MEQRAYGLLLFELIERHDGSTPAALTAVRAVAEQAAAAEPVRRPGFSKLVAALDAAADVNDTESAGGRRGRGLRPRSTFGRVLPRDHPDNAW